MRRKTRTDSSGPRAPRRPRPEPTPAQRALSLLVRREHSRSELARKLVARGVAETEAAEAVTRMADAGWQDDQRFACSIARARAAGGYGPAWIRAELGSHGIGESMIDRAFAALAEAGEDDWDARARDLVALGVDGNRMGMRLAHRKVHRRVDELLHRAPLCGRDRPGDPSAGDAAAPITGRALTMDGGWTAQ